MLTEPPSLIKIVAIVFPVFAIAFLGWAYGKRHPVEMGEANRLNLDIFIPALVFSSLADTSFDLAGHRTLAFGYFLMIVGSGLIGWVIAAIASIPYKILVPAMMFNNCGNLGLPVAALAFGPEGLAGAVVMFLVFNLMQFSFGIWLLDHHAKWWNMWRSPVIAAAFAGLGMSFAGLTLWPPLQGAIRMLGDVSIPMALFALGVRIASSRVANWRIGFIGALARPAAGLLITWLVALLLGLQGQQKALLLIFGALPPAMLNYVFAERYRQGPDEVATIVMLGNLAAVVILPLVLAVVL
jgi:hypothetical protein